MRTFRERLEMNRNLPHRIALWMARLCLMTWMLAGPSAPIHCQEKGAPVEKTPPKAEILVPQVLLGLLHAPEVQQELGFKTGDQREKLESVLTRVDGDWWRSRGLPIPERRKLVAQCERTVRDWLFLNVSRQTLDRLEQLEYRAQGARVLLRKDLADELRIGKTVTQKMIAIAATTDLAAVKLDSALREGSATPEMHQALAQARDKESRAMLDLLSREQQVEFHRRLGPDFDTQSLQRIYPLAPELAVSRDWINSSPLTLKQLRGQVIILHFYAFECINCQRNLPIYQKWHDDWADKGVTVLGIQTPETAAEKRLEAVSEAARRDGITYPVLVDLESRNWKAWGNTMWPSVYVIDSQGYIRQWWQGELRWQGATGDQQMTALVEKLLAERRKPRTGSGN